MTNLSHKDGQYFIITNESTSNTIHISQIDDDRVEINSMRIGYEEVLELINSLTEFTKYHG